MLQGKPFLPPAAVPGTTARLPGSPARVWLQDQPEDAALLRSSFLNTCLAPFDWEGGIQRLKLGVWVKEKKSLKWYNEQWLGLEGLFLSEKRVFSWNDSEFCSPRRGAGEGEAPGGLIQERQTKRKGRQCFVPSQAGNQPAADQATLLASFTALCRGFLPCIFYSLLLLKDR